MDATTAATAAQVAVGSTKDDKPEIVLYWLEQSRSHRVLWLLEELDLPYKLEIYHRDPKTRLAPKALHDIHPLGKSPVIKITPPGSAQSTTIAESAAICEYLTEHYGREKGLEPKKWKEGMEGKVCGETEEYMRYRYFMHYAEGSLMYPLFLALIAKMIENSPVPFFIKPITRTVASKIFSGYIWPNSKLHFEFLEGQLKTSPGSTGKPYLCGAKLTSADILLSFPLIAAQGGRAGELTEAKYPLLYDYIGRLEQEPGYKKAVDVIVEREGSFSPVI